MKFLRLPSGINVNVDKIVDTAGELGKLGEHDVFLVYYSYPTEDGVATYYIGADARALYAWFVENSTPIGEDGKKLPSTREMSDKELDALAYLWNFPQGRELYDYSRDVLLETHALIRLEDEGYLTSIAKAGDIRKYILSEKGRAFVKKATE